MQKQNTAHLQGLEQIEKLIKKVIDKASSIKQFQHAQLFKQKAEQFVGDFNKKQSQSVQEHLKQLYKLRLAFRTESKLQSENITNESESKKVKVTLSPPNIFLYSFEFPCLYKTYEHMIKNEEIQKKVDDIISDYKVLEQIGTNESMNIQLVYLSYKRVLIIAPREFVYIRIFFRDEKNGENNVYWIITFSVPYELESDKTRADVIFTAQKIEESIQQNKIFVKVYSQVDMKTAAKADIAKSKGFTQIKKYIHKLHDYSKLFN